MGDVTAEMIERGRKGDPAEIARRRKMTIKLRHARQSLTAKADESSSPYDSMVRLFAQSAKSATPAQIALTVAIGGGAMLLAPYVPVLLWGLLILPLIGGRYALGSAYLKLRDPERSARLWRIFFTLTEAGFGAGWAIDYRPAAANRLSRPRTASR